MDISASGNGSVFGPLFAALALIASAALIGCSSGDDCGGNGDWYYHWSCNGDSECLATNPGGTPSGSSDEGNQVSCDQLLQFGNNFWGSAASQSCDQSSGAACSGGATYSVIYDGNGNTGGAVPVDTTRYVAGQSATVLGNTGALIKTGSIFSSWNSKADGTGQAWRAGQMFRMNAANATLFASWTPGQSGGGSGGGAGGGSGGGVGGGNGGACGTGWSAAASLPTARSNLAAAAVGNIIYALGGQSSTVLATNEAYDTVANSWSTKAPIPIARKDFAVGVLNGIIYVVGGVSDGNGAVCVTELDAYDPGTNTWSVKAPLPGGRDGLEVAVSGGILYAMGGTPCTSPAQWINTVQAYDPVANSWSTKAQSPTGHDYGAAAALNGSVYVLGGTTSVTTIPVTTFEAYATSSNTWAAKASMPTARTNLGIGAACNLLFAIGGSNSQGIPLAAAESYDPVANAWSTRPALPGGRTAFGTASVNGDIFVLGGAGTSGVVASVERYH